MYEREQMDKTFGIFARTRYEFQERQNNEIVFKDLFERLKWIFQTRSPEERGSIDKRVHRDIAYQ